MPAPFRMVPVFAFISPLRYEDTGSTGAIIHIPVSYQAFIAITKSTQQQLLCTNLQ
jgi:hypothetical protein